MNEEFTRAGMLATTCALDLLIALFYAVYLLSNLEYNGSKTDAWCIRFLVYNGESLKLFNYCQCWCNNKLLQSQEGVGDGHVG